jgi:hypothetical protein
VGQAAVGQLPGDGEHGVGGAVGVSARSAAEGRPVGAGGGHLCGAAESDGGGAAGKKTQLPPKVDLKQLIAAKLLVAGDTISCKKKEGRIAADGLIDFNGKRMKSLSQFAHACGVASTVSGWRSCQVKGHKLDSIRGQFLSSMAGGSGAGAGQASPGPPSATKPVKEGAGRSGGARMVDKYCHNPKCRLFARRVRLGAASSSGVPHPRPQSELLLRHRAPGAPQSLPRLRAAERGGQAGLP